MRFAHERLVEARLTLDLTQEDLARAVGIDVRTYRRYESGAVNQGGFDVRRAERRRIVDALGAELGLTFDDLVVPDPPIGPHVLPPTRGFVGRRALLDELRSWRDRPDPVRLVAVVGIGGAGKTALARQMCEDAFVWSFYQDPKVEAFVDALLLRLGEPLEPVGSRMDRVEAALRRAGSLLLVLDGLEVVQADGSADRALGELEDPPLRRLVLALATGLGRVKVLLTSRFALADLESPGGPLDGYRRIDLPPLSADESAELLRSYGLSDVVEVASWVGGHALSVAMAGSYLRRGGRRLKELVDLDLGRARRDDPLARRLLSVLEAHTAHLAPEERSVFAALSIFPAGATVEALAGLPLAVPDPEVVRAAGRLEELGLVQSDGRRWWLHPLVARFAGTLLERGGAALHEAERARLAEGLGTRLDIDDAGALDQVERLVHHTLGAGRPQDAFLLYERVLGGFDHLGLRRGDFSRGARITRAFGEGALPPRDRAQLRYANGLYGLALGDLIGARGAYGRVAAEARATGDPVLCTTALRALAYVARLQGDFAGATEPSRTRSRSPSRWVTGRTWSERGRCSARSCTTRVGATKPGPSSTASGRSGTTRSSGAVCGRRSTSWTAASSSWHARGPCGTWTGVGRAGGPGTWRTATRSSARSTPGPGRSTRAAITCGGCGAGPSGPERWRWCCVAHLLGAELGDAEDGRVGAEKARRLGYGPLADRLSSLVGPGARSVP